LVFCIEGVDFNISIKIIVTNLLRAKIIINENASVKRRD